MPEVYHMGDPEFEEATQRSLLRASIATKFQQLLKEAAGTLSLHEDHGEDPVADCYSSEERDVIGTIANGIVAQIVQMGKDTDCLDEALSSVAGYLLACGMRMGYLAHEHGIPITPGRDQEDPLPELFNGVALHTGHEQVYELLSWLYTPEAIIAIGQYANSIADYARHHEES